MFGEVNRSPAAYEQKSQRGFGRLLHLQREQSVGAGPAEIDRGDRLSGGGRHLDEAEARIDHQRGADDQHGVGFARDAARPHRPGREERSRRKTPRRA